MLISSLKNPSFKTKKLTHPKLFYREEISELSLELLALDSGTPRLTGTGTLRVVVEDVNDNQPTFENDVYFLSTDENVDVGTALDRVLAVDRDSGLNAKIRLVKISIGPQDSESQNTEMNKLKRHWLGQAHNGLAYPFRNSEIRTFGVLPKFHLKVAKLDLLFVHFLEVLKILSSSEIRTRMVIVEGKGAYQ